MIRSQNLCDAIPTANAYVEPNILARVLSSPDLETSLHHIMALQYKATLAIVDEHNQEQGQDFLADGRAMSRAKAIAISSYELAHKADEALGGPIERRGHHCQPGCSFCCWLPVDVLAPEALAITTFLQENLEPPALVRMTQRITETEQMVFRLNSEECIRAEVPCPLLDLESGMCRAYSMRPHACRQYASFQRSACEKALGDPDAAVPTDFLSQTVYSRVMMGVVVALHKLGMDYHTLDLVSALRIALTEPEPAGRWFTGEGLFAPAWRSSREPGDIDPAENDLRTLRRLCERILLGSAILDACSQPFSTV